MERQKDDQLPKKPRSFKKGRDDRVGLAALGADPEKAREDQLTLLHQVTNAKDVEGYQYMRNLDLTVGSSGFATWYMISSSFPLIAAAIGPLANMCAIAALAEPWLYYPSHSYPKDNGGTKYDTIKDKPWITALNAVSLLMGVLSNLSLLLNFAGRINYTFSQLFSIGGFFAAGVILMTLTMICKYVLLNDELGLTSSYWHAVLTASCYFASSLLLFINEIGHLKGYYGATFNLSKAQRSLMLQNIALVVWIASGAGLFQYLMDLSYPDALYLCQVSLLTIGLGDLHPLRVVSRALMIPFALIGTLILGLIISSIRSMILTSSSETLTWNYAERNRKKEIKNIDNADYNERDGFEKMREFHDKAESYRMWLHLFFSTLIFAGFLTLGALCFYLVEEDWTYFDGIYFCCLCLLTIGYGDPAPNSTVGRSFFIVWSMAAVPMMTILISSMGDTIIRKVMDMSDKLGDWALEFHGFGLPHMSTRSREAVDDASAAASVAGEGDDPSSSSFHQRALSLFRSTRRNTNDNHDTSDKNGNKPDSTSSDAESVCEKPPEPIDKFPTGDYLQDLSSTIVALTLALQGTFDKEVNEPHYKYSFDEWKHMLRLCSRLLYLRNPEAFRKSKLSPDERADKVMEGDDDGDSQIEEEICSIASILQDDQNEQARETLKKEGLPIPKDLEPPKAPGMNSVNSISEIIKENREHAGTSKEKIQRLGTSKENIERPGTSKETSKDNGPEIQFQEPKKQRLNPLPEVDVDKLNYARDHAPKHASEVLPHYWLSDLSPLRFPVRENRIFNKKYLNTLEAVSLLMKKALEEAEGG